MPIFGSDGGFLAENRGGVIDDLGNTIVSANTSFAASPLGVAARTQALYGIPNANFNLLPPQPSSPIVPNKNDLPYWDFNNLSDGVMTATTVFDATTQTWGVELNPGTAASGASMTLSTRSYLINDDNLALRQKALAVLSKSGTAAVSTQWNLTLSAIYYDGTDTALSTAFIGTALDTGTWTSFAGTTTPGGSAISAAAQYVDLTFTLTTTAAVTGSAKATIKSLLLATSSAQSKSFTVSEVFLANGTWTRPIGVDYVTVMGIGGGGGGASGTARAEITNDFPAMDGSGGGGSGLLAVIQNLPVTAATYSIGIGSGGAGGTATSATKGAGTAGPLQVARTSGADGGATTFGSLLTFGGGSGATARTGAALGSLTSVIWPQPSASDGANGGAGGVGSSSTAATVGGTGANYTYLPYYAVAGTAGASGGAGSTTGTVGTETLGVAGTSIAGWVGGGGAGGFVAAGTAGALGTASNGGAGAGGGGASARRTHNLRGTLTATGGTGGAGAANYGGGGGAGGDAAVLVNTSTEFNASVVTLTTGAGGAGGSGLLVVSYVA